MPETPAYFNVIDAAEGRNPWSDSPPTAPKPETSGSVIWCNRCAELVSPTRLSEHNASDTHRTRKPRPLAEPAA